MFVGVLLLLFFLWSLLFFVCFLWFLWFVGDFGGICLFGDSFFGLLVIIIFIFLTIICN